MGVGGTVAEGQGLQQQAACPSRLTTALAVAMLERVVRSRIGTRQQTTTA